MNVPKNKVEEALAALLDNLPPATIVRVVASAKGFRVSVRDVSPTYASLDTARRVLAEHLASAGGGATYALSVARDEVSAGLVCDTPQEATANPEP
jgi:hypothetical protein